MIISTQSHPANDHKTKVAVFNKFLEDIKNQELPDGFNKDAGKIIFILKDYEVQLTDEKNQWKLNQEGMLETIYTLPSSKLTEFKAELLANSQLWEASDFNYSLEKEMITSDQKLALEVAKTVELEKKLGFFGNELKEKILYLVAEVNQNSYEAIAEFYEDLGAGYEFSEEQLNSIGIYNTLTLQTFLQKKGEQVNQELTEASNLHDFKAQTEEDFLSVEIIKQKLPIKTISKKQSELEL